MSIFSSILRTAYKLSGTKKAFALPEDALRKEIEKHGLSAEKRVKSEMVSCTQERTRREVIR